MSNLANNFGFALFAPLYGVYVLELGATPQVASYIWAAYTFLTAILLLVFGRVENRWNNKLKPVLVGNVLQISGSVLILMMPLLAGLLVGLLVYGAGTAILGPSWYYLFSVHMDKRRGPEEWSWSSGGASFAISAGAATGGLLIAAYSFRGVFIFMILSGIVGLLSVYRLYNAGTSLGK
jgi:MFS family permease